MSDTKEILKGNNNLILIILIISLTLIILSAVYVWFENSQKEIDVQLKKLEQDKKVLLLECIKDKKQSESDSGEFGRWKTVWTDGDYKKQCKKLLDF